MNKTTLWVMCIILGQVLLPIIGFMFFVTGLGLFHLIQKCKGKTTREYLKNKEKVLGDGIGNDWFSCTPSFLKFSMVISKEKGKELKNYIYSEDEGGHFKIGEGVDENKSGQEVPGPVNLGGDYEQTKNENKINPVDNANLPPVI